MRGDEINLSAKLSKNMIWYTMKQNLIDNVANLKQYLVSERNEWHDFLTLMTHFFGFRFEEISKHMYSSVFWQSSSKLIHFIEDIIHHGSGNL